jgi:hypothetical protein
MRMHALHKPLRFTSLAFAGSLLLSMASTATAETRTIPGTDVTATACVGCTEADMRGQVSYLGYGHHHFYDVPGNTLRSFRMSCEQEPWLGRPGGDDRSAKPKPESGPSPSSMACNGTLLVFEAPPDQRVFEEFDFAVKLHQLSGGSMKTRVVATAADMAGIMPFSATAQDVAGDSNLRAQIETYLRTTGLAPTLVRGVQTGGSFLLGMLNVTDGSEIVIEYRMNDGSYCEFIWKASSQASFVPRSCRSPGNQLVPEDTEFDRFSGKWEPEAGPYAYSGGGWIDYMRDIGVDVSLYSGVPEYESCSYRAGKLISCVQY